MPISTESYQSSRIPSPKEGQDTTCLSPHPPIRTDRPNCIPISNLTQNLLKIPHTLLLPLKHTLKCQLNSSIAYSVNLEGPRLYQNRNSVRNRIRPLHPPFCINFDSHRFCIALHSLFGFLYVHNPLELLV